MNKWISVKEKLPGFTEDGYREKVLIYGDGFMCIGWMEGTGNEIRWYSVCGNYPCGDITHWMPSPEAPND